MGAVLQTCNPKFGVDSVTCEIIDELEINMLPDFVEGERAISFQIHFQKKYGSDFTLKVRISYRFGNLRNTSDLIRAAIDTAQTLL